MNFFSNTHLTESTYSAYNSKINKWISIMPSPNISLSFIYTHPNFSIVQLRKYLAQNNIDTASTLNSYIKSILSAAEHNSHLFDNISDEQFTKSTERLKELRQKTYEYANAYRIEQKPSPTQSLKQGSSLKFNDLTKLRDELPDGSIDKLLLSLYTYIPPVRADFFATEILQINQIPNYPNRIFINTDKSYLQITKFKTAHIYKSIEYELPIELHKQIIYSISLQPRTFLFQNKNGDCFTPKTFSDWASKRLTKLFKKQFTLTLFRHIYISNLDPNTSAEVLIDISKKMGHTITQQMLYRWKDQPEIVEE
jgi:hypothetical protein